MISQRISTAMLVGGAAVLATPLQARAQALPSPSALAASLDLECYRTPGPSLDTPIVLSQLNPVLADLPPQQVILRELAQTCVPVRKNTSGPAAAAAPFVRNIDFACYRIDAPPLPAPVPLSLTHLNPVLANFPAHGVRLIQGRQLCLPIAKNDVLPPDPVLQVVRFLDLECFETEPGAHPTFTLNLTQLNPQLTGIAPHLMTLGPTPRQMCVPVRKGAQDIPAPVLNLVRWIDLEKFAATPPVTIAPVPVVLRHLNPRFVTFPPVPVTLETANALMLPVAKNGQFPPAD